MTQATTTASNRDEMLLCISMIVLMAVTHRLWEEILLVLQSIGVILSLAYSFFGGMGIHKFAVKVRESKAHSPFRLAIALWALFLFIPTTVQLMMPLDLNGAYFPNRLLAAASTAITLGKVLLFVYGFGYAVIACLGWVLIALAYNSHQKKSAAGYSLTIYILLLGLVTLITTIQIAVGVWFPDWIPVLGDVCILRLIWLAVSAAGLMIDAYSFNSSKHRSLSAPRMPHSHKLLITLGTFLIIFPSFTLIFSPIAVSLVLTYYSGWNSVMVLLMGLSFVVLPVLSWAKQRNALKMSSIRNY